MKRTLAGFRSGGGLKGDFGYTGASLMECYIPGWTLQLGNTDDKSVSGIDHRSRLARYDD